ncbi:MAG: DedA family protein [Blastocatellia bacterium]|jgi:membrane protein DedA with SNARE-associated domain
MMIENLIREYGLWAVFFGVMIEGDLTLLFAGALAHYGLFGFTEALLVGTVGGFIGDSASYLIGYWGRERIKHSHIYLHTRPRLERLSARFGIFAVFLVKYIYGLRTASAIFWGFAPMGYRRFGPLTLLSCLAWVVVLLGGGFFFSGAIEVLIGEVERVGLLLLTAFLIACAVALILYLTERYVIARQVPEMEPLSLQEMYDEVKSEEKAVEGKGGGDK